MIPVLAAALAIPEDRRHAELHRPAPHLSMGKHLRQAYHRTLHGHRPILRENVAREPDTELEKSLAQRLDGCQNVFVDAGARLGMHARFLFEPENYPESTFVQVFDEQFGPAEKRQKTTCAIEFEPNPKHRARHEALVKAYAKVGWRVIYAPYGISDVRSELTFYTEEGTNNRGFSTNEFDYDDPSEFNVTSIDLAAFLHHLDKRSGTYPNHPNKLGKVVLKL
jgi:hypothetical protein